MSETTPKRGSRKKENNDPGVFQYRVVRHEMVALDDILFHDGNWKIHPGNQQEGVDYSLKKVGWLDDVMVNLRTSAEWPEGERGVQTLLNGHLRCTLAARAGATEVPVKFVDLTPEEERFVLATFDPLGQMSLADNDKVLELAAQLDTEQSTVRAALRQVGVDVRKAFVHLENGEQVRAYEMPSIETATRKPASSRSSGQDGAREYSDGAPERFPLAIVLSRPLYKRWAEWRTRAGAVNDLIALVALLDYVEKITEDGEDD